MFSALDLCLGSLGILFVLGRFAIDVILDFLTVLVSDDGIITLFRADVATVAAYGFLFAVQEFRHHCHIMLVCRRDLYRMHKPRILVHAYMSLVSKVPRIPLFHRMCIGIPLFFLVFRRRRRRNDGRIHDRTFFQDQSTLSQCLDYQCEELFMNVVFDQKIAESSNRIAIGYLVAGFNFAEIRKCPAVNDFVPGSFVGQVIQVLSS